MTACDGGDRPAGPAPEETALPSPTGTPADEDPTDAPPEQVPEIRPGILQGYLAPADMPDSLGLVPPPPAEGSASLERDHAVSRATIEARTDARFELATTDADLTFPSAAERFVCAIGSPISEEQTPHLYMLLRRTLADAGLSTYGAKNEYNRARPFMENGVANCTPDEDEELRHDGSYPSGHTAIGWAWALLLAELVPERANEIFARGLAFGESRIVCNVHWQSDVDQGRLLGAAAVARLHADESFSRAMQAAKRELAAVATEGATPPAEACAAEAAALAAPAGDDGTE
ncbi:MAG: phosphatase PAP2 family protein [Deltaproteobacteria bacterium]|nr:phosphatase PAP2 family protein [Deltaproteobacteria bacterium]